MKITLLRLNMFTALSLVADISAMLILAFGFMHLNRRLRRFLSAFRKAIAPHIDLSQGQGGLFQQLDELNGALAQLSQRMSYMIDQMADKVLVDQEVQSAEIFQSRFLPTGGFESKNFALDGRYLPANQCSGDWWQFFACGDEFLVLIGDVTGHGVSAALVTAAVQAAYSVVVSQTRNSSKTNARLPSLNSIFSYLNEAVLAVGGNEASMTLFGSILNLRTGTLISLNASHRPAYVFRTAQTEGDGKQTYHLAKTLTSGQMRPLGEGCDHTVSTDVFQLCPGDFVLWYTDGLVECMNSSGKVISKKALIDALQRQMSAPGLTPAQLCDGTLQEFFKFIGGRMAERKDDVIVLFGGVPLSASFGQALGLKGADGSG